MPPSLRSQDRMGTHSTPQKPQARLVPNKNHKTTCVTTKKSKNKNMKKKEKRANRGRPSARIQHRNRSRSPLLSLPAEIRLRIYHYAIASATGPEVFVGVGSHEPTKSMRATILGPLAAAAFGQTLDNWNAVSWFYSKITGNYEIVRSNSVRMVYPFVDYPSFGPIGLPIWIRRARSRPGPLKEDRERHWPDAILHYLRPFRACTVLYQEARVEFFKSRHFILGSSTYALAWLRRIGRRNALDLRSVRLKVHREFYVSTGGHRMGGLHWDEVLGRLRRSAPRLEVLGLHCEEGHRQLLDAEWLLRRAPAFPRLCRVDLYVWGADNGFGKRGWYHHPHPQGAAPAGVCEMMQSFVDQTEIPIRLIEACNLRSDIGKAYECTLSGKEWYVLSHDVRAGQVVERHIHVDELGEPLFRLIDAYEACLQNGV